MSSKWIDWNKVYNDPFTSLYKEGLKGLDEYSADKIAEIYKNEKHLDDKWKAHHQKTIDLKQEIVNEKKKNKIGWRKFGNFLIIGFGIITLSIVFWVFYVPYKSNKEIINNFNKFKLNKEQEIAKLNDLKFQLLSEMLNKYSTGSLFNEMLKAFDVNWYQHDLYLPNIAKDYTISLPNNTIQTNYETFNIKNRDITIYNYEELNIKPVTTYQSISWTVSYQNSEGEWRTRTVTYTGSHTEPTPFMEWMHPVCFTQSNFDLDFSLTESRKKSIIKLENSIFNKRFLLDVKGNIDTGKEVKTRQVFTVLTQENYVKMADTFDVNLHKFNNTLLTFNKNNLDAIIYTHASLMQYYNFDTSFQLKDALNMFFSSAKSEMSQLFKSMTIMYGSPTFAQEDVSRNNRHYLIRNFHNLDQSEYVLDENDFQDLSFIALNKYDCSRKLEGVTGRVMDRMVYKPNGLFKQINEDTYIIEYSRIWYITERLYDPVIVGSPSDGYRTVMVPYTRYYERNSNLFAILKGVIHDGKNFQFKQKFEPEQIQAYLNIAKKEALLYTIKNKSLFLVIDDEYDNVLKIAYNL